MTNDERAKALVKIVEGWRALGVIDRVVVRITCESGEGWARDTYNISPLERIAFPAARRAAAERALHELVVNQLPSWLAQYGYKTRLVTPHAVFQWDEPA